MKKAEVILITRLINYNNYNSFSGCDVVVSAQMAPINGGAQMKVHVLGSLQTMSYSTHQDRAPVRSIGNINAIDYVQGQRTIAGTMVFAMFHQHWMTPLLEELENHVPNTDIWSDELPALNLTISMANEYGYKSNMVLYGVKFIDDGGVMSINDLYTENTLQYVATGIQPLKTSGQFDHSCSATMPDFPILGAEEYDRKIWEFNPDLYTKAWPKYRDIVIDITNTPPTIYPFSLSAIIDPPLSVSFFDIVNEDTPHNIFVVTIVPEIYDPRDKITNIFLNDNDADSDPSNKKEYPCIKNPITNEWVVEVPEGYYNVDIKTESGNTHENVCNLEVSEKTSSETSVDYEEKSTPVIRRVEDTAVSIIPNLSFDVIEVKRVKVTGESFTDIITDDIKNLNIYVDIPIGKNNNKEIMIEDLLPGEKYYINTYNSETKERSNYVSAKTFESQSYINTLLKDFITTNSNLLVNNELVNYDLSNTKFEYGNLLDSLLDLPNSDMKSELLLYATLLQNKIINAYNDNGVGNNISFDAQSILNNTYYIDEEVEDIVLYQKKKTRSYYVNKAQPKSEFKYDGNTNTHYYIQPNLKTNKKSTCVDFVCFNQQQQNLLNNYRSVVDLDSLPLIRDSYTYNSYNSNLIRAIKAVENLSIHKNILEEPHATLYNDTLLIDVDYSEKTVFAEDLYLCIATPEEAVSNTPIIKIKIDSSLMTLDKYRTFIMKDKYYLLWIQDASFRNLSPAFILSTYENDANILDYYYNRNETRLNRMISAISGGSIYKTYLNSAIDIILAEENISYKNIEYNVLQALLLLYEDHLMSRTIDDVMNYVVSQCFNDGNVKCTFIKDDDEISYECNNRNVSLACVNITQSNIKKINCGNAYDINTYNEGYSLLYLIDENYNTTSNVMLINNITKEVFASNIALEVIK